MFPAGPASVRTDRNLGREKLTCRRGGIKGGGIKGGGIKGGGIKGGGSEADGSEEGYFEPDPPAPVLPGSSAR